MATGALGIADASNALIVDLYKNLNLERSADSDSIRKAYRKMALKYHPDKNNAGDAFDHFKMVSEAYDILSNQKLRAIYDQYGPDGLKYGVPSREGFEGYSGGYYYHGQPFETFAQFFGSKNPFADFFAVHDEAACSVGNRPNSGKTTAEASASNNSAFPHKFGEKFGGMYGMNSSKNAALNPPKQDPPVAANLDVTLEELYLGSIKKIKIFRKVLTEDGVTTTDVEKILTVEIQKGWKDGTRVTFPREGDQGPNKIPADIVFVIKELPHSRFKREGNDLVFITSMTLGQALLGTIVEVVTLDDRKLQIPINDVVHPEYVKAVSKEGMPISKSTERGKLLLRFHVTFPTFLNADQKKAIKGALQ
ncbi:DnaJ sub B member 13 [Physocladia obscura]|uniref:DnaJ sub B member 13 n=1 Tax=Physocladia obscura TaxID=109957 RepID=A0AAD5X9R4_9FUNG|nr:DnaJ sub B member 13 [Physocladia obscura]